MNRIPVEERFCVHCEGYRPMLLSTRRCVECGGAPGDKHAPGPKRERPGPDNLTGSLWPVTPPSNGTETSDAARDSLTQEQINDGHRAVLNALWKARESGLTDEEIQARTKLNPSTERPRRGELVEYGRVVDTGERRPTKSGRPAIVWNLSPETIRAVLNRKSEAA